MNNGVAWETYEGVLSTKHVGQAWINLLLKELLSRRGILSQRRAWNYEHFVLN